MAATAVRFLSLIMRGVEGVEGTQSPQFAAAHPRQCRVGGAYRTDTCLVMCNVGRSGTAA